MINWDAHLIIGPIVLPMVIASAMLLLDERRRTLKAVLSLSAMAAILVMALVLLHESANGAVGGGDTARVYRLGSWAAPYGIVLVADRLSTMMVALTSVLGGCALIFALARWDRAGPRFHALFLLLIMGVNGALLTGDLFNLFVFFEVMLAASYGLLLHGTGRARVGAGLHYIAINLLAAMMFLLGVALIYGVTGTLNMADLATRVPVLSPADRPLVHAAAVLLAGAFLIKAAMWPLCFWLPNAYSAAAPPVAAVFSIMTKVGVYTVIRLGLLLFGQSAGASSEFGAEVLVVGGFATIAFGMVGVLASQDLSRMTGNLVLVSSGTLLSVVGLAIEYQSAPMLSGGLYYMFASTLAIAALFLLAEPIGRKEGGIAGLLAVTAEAYGIDPEDEMAATDAGPVIPGATTLLGIAFMTCVMVVAGLPPFAGFVGKLAMLTGAVDVAATLPFVWGHWLFVALMILSGLATMIAMVRWGIQSLWANADEPPLPVVEIASVMALVGTLVVLTVGAEPAMRYLDRTADALTRNSVYIGKVMDAAPKGGGIGPGTATETGPETGPETGTETGTGSE